MEPHGDEELGSRKASAQDVARGLLEMANQLFAVPAGFGKEAQYAALRIEPALQAALQLAPDLPEVVHALAAFYGDRGEQERAVEVLATARERAVVCDQTVFAECLYRLRLGDLVGALAVHHDARDHLTDAFYDAEKMGVLLRTLVSSPAFDRPLDAHFDGLFFVEALLTKSDSWLRHVGPALQDAVILDLFAYAKAQVEDQGARFMVFHNDTVVDIKRRSETELMLLGMRFWKDMGGRQRWLRSGPPHVVEHYGDLPHFSREYLEQIFNGPKSHIQTTRVVLEDFASTHVNVEQGCRRTTGQPEHACNRIAVFGASDIFSYGAEDSQTIASYLQQHVCREVGAESYRVENHGLRGSTVLIWLNNLLHERFAAGDIAIVWSTFALPEGFVAASGIEYEHISLERPHSHGELFIDHTHVGPRGNRILGKAAAKAIARSPRDVSSSPRPAHGAALDPAQQSRAHNALGIHRYAIYRTFSKLFEAQGLDDYVRYLDRVRVPGHATYGSVAVNCNPFTLGHLHLLEHAARQVDILYVFVIEEDMSFFPYAHRKQMVAQGVGHLPNVKVIDGGRYICTTITFPEYFTKEEANDVPADASVEAWFFCEYIAPRLGISRIFLGDEPKCQLTRKYNEKMLEILPGRGIDVEIIPRIAQGDRVISASSVREYLKAGDFDAIARITPRTTLEFLDQHYRPNRPDGLELPAHRAVDEARKPLQLVTPDP